MGLILAALLVLALSPLQDLTAQQQTPEALRRQAEQMLGRDLSNQEILDMLRQSGLSSQQIRDRLSARGFDPSAADPWLRVLEGRASRVPEGTSPAPLVSVLAGTDAGRGMGLDTTRIGRVPTDSLRPREPEFGPPVFGRQVFRRATSQFQPVTTGPVPPDYRVGPGDQLVLVLTGAVEQAYQLEVSDEGWVVIPEVGQVFVNGRTVEELRKVLFDRLAESYASLEGDPPTTHFDMTVGKLRTNQVYVIGAVEEPSAYVVSSLATAMTALYRAGGPTRNGSFREVRVNRGGETVATIDLYDYLVGGDASQDVRLQQGDIVHVPVAETQVRVQGPVTRPAIYELTGHETLDDLLRFAGGVEPNADLQRVQIRRILPPAARTPGRERAILDVPVGEFASEEDGGVALRDGDEVQVFAVVEDARNRVTVSGAVWRPGTYGAGDSTRIWDVIRAAGGLLPDAVEARAQIQRLEEETNTRRMIQVSLARNGAGEPVENPRLEGMDQVLIYARRNLREDERVTIGGWVRRPGVYPFAEGMTVADLILRAGGVRTGVYTARAEVARPVRSQTVTDTLTRRFEVSLDSSYVFEGRRPSPGELGGEAATFELRERDAVYVRRAPGYEEPKRVVVTGEVRFPGPYSIRTRQERLTDLVERAGGLTEEAYVEGLQLWRAEGPAADTLAGVDSLARRRQARIDSLRRARELLLPGQRDTAGARRGASAGALADTAAMAARQDSLLLQMYRLQQQVEELKREDARDRGMVVTEAPLLPVDSAQMVAERTRVGIDFPRALERPESQSNLLLQPGDSIHVPRYTPTVDVRGAVGVESKVLWREGADLGYYISRAGGYLEEADEGRVWIRFANGEVATRGGKFLFFGGGIPEPDPGSTINVPFEPPREPGGGLSTGQLLGILTSISTALIVAISR